MGSAYIAPSNLPALLPLAPAKRPLAYTTSVGINSWFSLPNTATVREAKHLKEFHRVHC